MSPLEDRGQLILVLGGARSGKSSFAETLVKGTGSKVTGSKVTYIATCQALDGEMAERIQLHQERRPAGWVTVEEPLQVADRLLELDSDVVLLDCLTLLVTNLLLAEDLSQSIAKREGVLPEGDKTKAILAEVERLAAVARDHQAKVVVVSNEVGMGLVPEHPLGRSFRDVAGWANQIMAAYADKVYMVIAGIPVEIKELGQRVWDGLGEDEGIDR